MKKQDILNLEGTTVNEERLMQIEESEFVTGVERTGVESYDYCSGQYQDCIGYAVTLDDGIEIEIYSYF